MAGAASASAQTCIQTSNTGLLCTYVNGSGDHVNYINVDYDDIGVTEICNYSAWFFYVPPGGGAYGLGYYYRAGCNFEHVWFNEGLNRNFPHHTQMCAKFYKNNGEYVGQKCVGLS